MRLMAWACVRKDSRHGLSIHRDDDLSGYASTKDRHSPCFDALRQTSSKPSFPFLQLHAVRMKSRSNQSEKQTQKQKCSSRPLLYYNTKVFVSFTFLLAPLPPLTHHSPPPCCYSGCCSHSPTLPPPPPPPPHSLPPPRLADPHCSPAKSNAPPTGGRSACVCIYLRGG